MDDHTHTKLSPPTLRRPSAWPLVSTIIPLHNGAHTIRAAIESIIAASYRPLEVVVIDDASTDAGTSIVEGMTHEIDNVVINLICNESDQNRGPGETRNIGIKAARGEFVTFLDADDLYNANRFTEAAHALCDDPSLEATVGRFSYLIESDENSEPRLHSPEGTVCGMDSSDDLFLDKLEGRLGMHTSTVTVRKSAFGENGLFPSLHFAEDKSLWLRLLARGKVVCLGGEPVSQYRIHEDSWCGRGRESLSYKFGPLFAALDFLKWSAKRKDIPGKYRLATYNYFCGKSLHNVPAALPDSSMRKMLRALMVRGALMNPRLLWYPKYLKSIARLFLSVMHSKPEHEKSL